MPTASPAPATLFALDEAWSAFPRRKAAVHAFIAGYCAARNRRDASLHDSPDGQVVQFDGGMGRPFEHFMIEGAPASGDGPFAVGAWITRYGAVPLPPALHGRTRRLSDETFMAAEIDALSGDDALARALACHTPNDIDAFNASDAFPPFQPNPAAFLFAHRLDGQIAPPRATASRRRAISSSTASGLRTRTGAAASRCNCWRPSSRTRGNAAHSACGSCRPKPVSRCTVPPDSCGSRRSRWTKSSPDTHRTAPAAARRPPPFVSRFVSSR